MSTPPIKIFFQRPGFGMWRYMSNFHHAPMTWEGKIYNTVEHLFQARKTADPAQHEAVRLSGSPRDARTRGRTIKMREGWDDMRVQVMRECVALKFNQHPVLMSDLMSTRGWELIEYAPWEGNDGKAFWGVGSDGTGQNMLGKLLMELRDN